MPLHFQCRFSDRQKAALEAAATVTDASTGIRTVLSVQQVVLSIVDAWIDAHTQPVSTSDGRKPTERASTSSPDSPLDGPQDTDRETSQGSSRIGSPVPESKLALAERVRALRKSMSHTKIAALLNDEGVPTLGTKPGAKWSNSSVERLEKFGLQDGD